ncbi:MAG TPA: hypothetical protein VK138_11400 [Acidiferrobacterales bacterium]|nr:hypothetical protein [Acidiferrobacterales bacterium]
MRLHLAKDTRLRASLIAFALLLFLTQLAYVYHQSDLDQHAFGDAPECQWCVAGSGLHGALASVSLNLFIPYPEPVFSHDVTFDVITLGSAYLSRAPPVTSFT